MRIWQTLLIFLLGGAAITSAHPPLVNGRAKGENIGLSPSASSVQNAAALSRIFANPGGGTFRIPAGTYLIPCGSSFVAAGPVSLIGAGMNQSVLRLDQPCVVDRPLMQWVSKNGVHLSGFEIDLNHARYASVQTVLSFEAYRGNASGLQVDHVAVINGTSPSLMIGVAASGGFAYSDVLIENNHLQMTPARTQNQCIALTTVNNSGRISGARIIGNTCRGSGIQGDGDGTVIADNDVSGYEFGQGIFIGYVTKAGITAANWANGAVTLQLNRATPHLVAGETVDVWGTVPTGYNGRFTIRDARGDHVSYDLSGNPGPFLRGGFISPLPGARNCIIRNNFIHDTGQTTDVNRTAPGGVENNCLDSLVTNNRLHNLGGPGFFNFANGARYIQNQVVGVGYEGPDSAGGDGDRAGFVAFDNGSGIKGYQSADVTFDGNEVGVQGGRPRFGYFEEPYHHFSSKLGRNAFNGGERAAVVRGP